MQIPRSLRNLPSCIDSAREYQGIHPLGPVTRGQVAREYVDKQQHAQRIQKSPFLRWPCTQTQRREHQGTLQPSDSCVVTWVILRVWGWFQEISRKESSRCQSEKWILKAEIENSKRKETKHCERLLGCVWRLREEISTSYLSPKSAWPQFWESAGFPRYWNKLRD